MGTGEAIGFALAGIFVAAIGVSIFGGLALMVAIVLIGIAVMALATEVEARTIPHVTQSSQPFRYACPGCGGDVYAGQSVCPACAHTLPDTQRPKG
jgi:hypothetical protein